VAFEAGGAFTSVGVSSTGALGTGVQGTGANFGVYGAGGNAVGQTGVYGSGYYGGQFTGGSVGVYAFTSGPLGTGGQFVGGIQGITAQGSGTGGIFTGNVGVQGFGQSANAIAVKGVATGGNGIGGEFRALAPSVTGVSSTGGVVGGQFFGYTNGVSASGATGLLAVGSNYGVNANGGLGNYFSNAGNTDSVYLATPGYGVYANVPSTDFAVYAATGKNYLGGTLTVGTGATISGVNLGPTGCGAGYYGISLNNTPDTNCTQYNLLSNGTSPDLMLNRPAGYKILFREANATQMTILNGGNVGIGTTAPDSKLTVNGTVDKPGGGSWGTFSDIRLKNVQGTYTRGLDDLMKLDPVMYQYKTDNALGLPSDLQHVGLVAQDVQKAVPEAVSVNDKGYLIVNNDPVIWTMMNSIKQLKIQNDRLQQEIDQLKNSR